MAKKFLDYEGLSHLWLLLKDKFAAKNHGHNTATTDADGFMSKSDKSKLDGIAENANNYVHPTHTEKSSGLYKVTVDGEGHVSNTSAVTKADITALGIPAQDTTYTHPTHTPKNSGLYKITVDGEGHVTGATDVAKEDITALGIPAQDTTYTLPEAGTELGGVKTGGNVTITNGEITVNDNSHNHKIGNIEGLNDALADSMSRVEYSFDGSDGTSQRAVTNATRLIDVDSNEFDPENVTEDAGFNVGSATQPVYFENGVPKVANSYTTATLTGMGVTATATELNYVDGVTSNIQTQIDGKATKSTSLSGYGIADAYTKTEADEAIAKAVADAGHITRSIVNEKPAANEAKANVIYMVKDTSVTSGDAYNEYMLIDGAVVQVGDTTMSLDGYVKEDDLTAIENTEIDTILNS